jgi:hypothetical protein
MTDVIQQLGALAFASRLKRLSERLQRDVSRVYREQKLEFHARCFSAMSPGFTGSKSWNFTLAGFR